MSDARSDRGADLEARLRSEGERLRAARAGCPSPDLLVARATGMLEAELQSGLDAHLDSCDACRRLAADIDALNLATPEPASDQRVRTRVFGGPTRGPWLLPLTAALILVTGVAVGWRVWPRASSVEDRRQAVVPPTAETPVTSSPVAALWAISPAPVRVPLSSLGPTRSGESAGDGLIEALSPYRTGDYASATDRLSEWVRRSPSSGEGHFYLGVSQLLAGDPPAASRSLARAHELLPAARRREVEWYQAAAAQRAGDLSGARRRLQTLCAEAGAYQTEACAAEGVLR